MEPTPQTRAALAAAAEFGLPTPGRLELVKRRENTVFRLEHGGAAWALRLHRPGYHPDADLDAEVDFVDVLGAAGVAVPRFLRTATGASFSVQEGGGHRYQVDAQEWLEGTTPFGDCVDGFRGTAAADPAGWEALGALAAASHDAIERLQLAGGGIECGERIAWDLDGIAGETPAWGDPLRLTPAGGEQRAQLEAGIEAMRRLLIGYDRSPRRYGPIHADLTPENVLVRQDGFGGGGELVLIDFDDFAQGWYLFDLATALFHYGPHPRYAELEAALLRGYETRRPLDVADREALPALILARGLSYLGWAADRRGEEEPERIASEVLPHVVRLARELAAR